MAERDPGDLDRIAEDASAVLLATVAALAVGFVTSIVVARLLGSAGRGLLGVAFSAATIAVAVASLGIPIATTYYASRRPRLMPTLIANGLAYACVLAVALPCVALAVATLADSWLGIDNPDRFWLLVALLTWAMFLEFLAANALRGRSRYRRLNLLTIASRVTALALTVGLVAVLDLGVEGAIAALACGSLVYAAVGLAPDLGRGARASRHVFCATVKYGWRVQIGRLIQIGNGRLDVLILSTLASLATVGVYVVAQVVAELATLVPAAIGFVTMPAIARSGRTGSNAPGAVRLSGSLALIGVVGVAAVGPPLIRLGYGSDFNGALEPLFILLPGVWLLGTGGVIAEVMRGRGRPEIPSQLAALAIVVTIVGDLLLIPRFDAIGAAVASTCAYAVFGGLSIVVMARMEGVPRRSLLVMTRRETRIAIAELKARLRGLRTASTTPGPTL